MAVADASVLIALAKIGKLGLLRIVFESVLITPTVQWEVVEQGRMLGAPDVIHVQRALDEGWLSIVELEPIEMDLVGWLATTTGLHAGEMESLAVAFQRRRVLLIDERNARSAARALGIEIIGSAGALFAAFRIGALDLAEMEDAVKDLARVLWISPDIVADILKRAREMNQ